MLKSSSRSFSRHQTGKAVIVRSHSLVQECRLCESIYSLRQHWHLRHLCWLGAVADPRRQDFACLRARRVLCVPFLIQNELPRAPLKIKENSWSSPGVLDVLDLGARDESQTVCFSTLQTSYLVVVHSRMHPVQSLHSWHGTLVRWPGEKRVKRWGSTCLHVHVFTSEKGLQVSRDMSVKSKEECTCVSTGKHCSIFRVQVGPIFARPAGVSPEMTRFVFFALFQESLKSQTE